MSFLAVLQLYKLTPLTVRSCRAELKALRPATMSTSLGGPHVSAPDIKRLKSLFGYYSSSSAHDVRDLTVQTSRGLILISHILV